MNSCYDEPLRRLLSIALLAFFSILLIAPVVSSSPDESALPACCRRNGKHHCMQRMQGMTQGSVSSPYHTISERCPYSPFAATALMLPHAFWNRVRPPTAATDSLSAVARIGEAEAGYRISSYRSRSKRGPPRLLEE